MLKECLEQLHPPLGLTNKHDIIVAIIVDLLQKTSPLCVHHKESLQRYDQTTCSTEARPWPLQMVVDLMEEFTKQKQLHRMLASSMRFHGEGAERRDVCVADETKDDPIINSSKRNHYVTAQAEV